MGRKCMCCGERVAAGRTVRGMCLACGSAVRRLVARGRTTWAEVVGAGMALPEGAGVERARQLKIMRRRGRLWWRGERSKR